MVLPSSISGSGGVGVGLGLRMGAGGGSPSVGAMRSIGVDRGTGVGVGVGRLTVVCARVCVGRAGTGVGVGVGTERGAMAELRRGRASWFLAATKLEPTKQVNAKTSATTKVSCRSLSLRNINWSLVRFIGNVNWIKVSISKTTNRLIRKQFNLSRIRCEAGATSAAKDTRRHDS